MRAARVIAVLLCAVLFFRSRGDAAAKPAPSGIRFLDDDSKAARTKVLRLGVPLFVDAWAPWCHTCQAAGKLTEAERAIAKGSSLVYGPRRARLEATAADIARARRANSAEPSPAEQALARTILRELVEIDTSLATGSTTPAARLVATRLRRAGLPARDVVVLGPTPQKQAVVARLRAKTPTKPPLLLLGHLDVVNAKRDDWTVDPYVLLERDGFLYGRGTLDMKALVSLWIANVVRLAREGGPRNRDVILALTPDEEDGPHNGVAWLLAHHPELVQAALALNEGGLGEIKDGRRRANTVQVAEKTYVVFDLRVRNKGGHSSLPEPDNAIVRLGKALARVHELVFPSRILPVTKAYFGAMAAFESGATAADLRTLAATPDGAAPDPSAVARLARSTYYNARLRTTCVPTQVAGGHARNALPQLATATVNCRVLPSERVEDVQAALVRAIDDPSVEIALGEAPTPGPPSPLDPELLGKATRITNELWPGVPVVPILSTGASDGRYLRAAGIPTYGISGLFHDVDDIRAHGRDERISVRSFVEAQEFTYRLIEALVAP